MQRDSISNTFLVAGLLCLVCSFLVSTAAVGLRPFQEANKRLIKRRIILQVAGIYDPNQSVDEQFSKKIEVRLIDLTDPAHPKPITDKTLIQKYDPREAAANPEMSVPITQKGSDTLPGIRRREKYSFVYLVKNGDKLEEVVLPIYGKGLWSTIYGFICLDSDLQTVRGIAFYEHGETPGLGGEIENPRWQALWKGKKVYDEQGQVALSVIKGHVTPGSPDAKYKVDGLSGATFTSKGVSRMIHFWLGDHGFGPYLKQLREEFGQ